MMNFADFDVLATGCELVGSGVDNADLQSWLERAMLRDRDAKTPRETGLLQACDEALVVAKKQEVAPTRCLAFVAVHTQLQVRRTAAEEVTLARRRAIEPQATMMRRKFRAASCGDMEDPTGKRGLARLFERADDDDHAGTVDLSIDLSIGLSIDYHELVSAARRIGRYLISAKDLAVIFDEIDVDKVLKMMNSALKMMEFALKLMTFAFTLVFKMMEFARTA